MGVALEDSEVNEAVVDDADLELDDVSDVCEEVTEDRLLSTEVRLGDSEVGREELRSCGELGSIDEVEGEVSCEETLLESGFSLVVGLSLNNGVSMEACV